MKRVSRDHYDSRNPIWSIYQGGLKGVFTACLDPLPDKMKELIHRLKDYDQDNEERVDVRRG